MAAAQTWMNERERHWIKQFDSYKNGLNRTRGGQLGRDQAWFEARLLDQERQWKIRLRAFKAFKTQFGHLLVKQPFRFSKTHPDVTLRAFRLGSVVNRIRTGQTRTTHSQKRILTTMGFVWKDVERFERTLGMREFKRIYGHLLVPTKFRFGENCPVPELRGYRLGKRVSAIRGGDIAISEDERAYLNQIGMVWDVPKFQLDRTLHGLRTFHQTSLAERGNLHVAKDFCFASDHSDHSLRGMRLGSRVETIRRGDTILTAEAKNELKRLNFIWRPRKQTRKLVLRAIRTYKAEHGDLYVNWRYVFPLDPKDVSLQGFRLGTVVSNIRSKHTVLSDEEKETLSHLGFVWKVKNSFICVY